MLIPSSSPAIRSGTSVCSSHSSQVYRSNRPAIKGKHRSLVPTVSSLLLGTIVRNHLTETSNDEIGDIHSMEAPIKNHEIPERPNVADALKPLHTDYRPDENYPTVSYSCLKSHRTEDIYVREDEDGVRTHFCPLNKSRDSPTKNEGEDRSAKHSKLDIEAELFLKTFSLKSEDITSLVAEKPPLSESDDENDNSDFNASTSMFHASYRNREFVSADNSMEFLIDHQMSSLPTKTLDENIMSSWLEDSSEGEESLFIPSVSDRNEEMIHRQKYTVLVESDMEEFERRPEPNVCGFEELKNVSQTKQTNLINKNLLNNEESSNNKIDKETYNEEKSNLTNISVIKIVKSNAQENFPVLKLASENSIQKSKTSKEISNSECCPNDVVDDEGQINDLLKAVVEQASINAEVNLQITPDKILQNSESYFKEEESDLKSESMAAERHLLKDTNTQVKKIDDVLAESNIIWGTERDCGKLEENASIFKVYINTENPSPDVSVRCKVSKEPGAERKREMKGNFAMEPMSLHSKNSGKNEETQPDLATALSFMTEVFPSRNDDELYFDTLSTSSDHSSEKSEKESPEASPIFRKYLGGQKKPPTNNHEKEASATGSAPFEPVIVEDQRTVKRPRNKFSKFFQSFKKRLGKKS